MSDEAIIFTVSVSVVAVLLVLTCIGSWLWDRAGHDWDDDV